MNLNVSKNPNIYIAAPAHHATGGPELLHQLAFILNKEGMKACMYYVPRAHPDPVHPEYVHYNNPIAGKIEDEPGNILIVPEVYSGVSLLQDYRYIQKVLWWLSVDNFYTSKYCQDHKYKSLLFRLVNEASKKLWGNILYDLPNVALRSYLNYNLREDPIISQVNLHLTQSEYAMQHLSHKSIHNTTYLSDYLNDEFLQYNYETRKRENIVLYSLKGYKFTQRIIPRIRNGHFVPLRGLTKKQVIELMRKAKVYIDFGNHPGKDRMPREAAICGCCVITGRRGSAAFYEDVPIPQEYKFDETAGNVPLIVEKISFCLEHFANASKDFEEYRSKIKREKEKFLEDVRSLDFPGLNTAY